MKYWVYKFNSGVHEGNFVGDWEGVDSFGGDKPFEVGPTDDVPRLSELRRGDRVIAHQSNRHQLVGVAEVLGPRAGLLMVKPIERIGANMTLLRKRNADIRRIPAYRPGPIASIYDISNRDARLLLRKARISVDEATVGSSGDELVDPELAAFEGWRRKLFIYHRRREQRLRAAKIAQV